MSIQTYLSDASLYIGVIGSVISVIAFTAGVVARRRAPVSRTAKAVGRAWQRAMVGYLFATLAVAAVWYFAARTSPATALVDAIDVVTAIASALAVVTATVVVIRYVLAALSRIKLDKADVYFAIGMVVAI